MSEDVLYPDRPKLNYKDPGYDAAMDAWYDNKVARVPTQVGKFAPTQRATLISLNGRKLQVIVKLANIELTPEKPDYSEATWHVEGMRNENIVATGIYYYDVENISESRLAFRTDVHEPEDYEQSDFTGVQAVYGFTNDDPLVQEIGSVTCVQGLRCVPPSVPPPYLLSNKPLKKKRESCLLAQHTSTLRAKLLPRR